MPSLLARLLVCLSLLPALAMAEGQPLPPTEAFRYEVSADAEQVYIDWELEPGYYLYQHKLSVAADSLSAPQFPTGIAHEDDYFGKQTIYREKFRVAVPHNAEAGPLALTIGSQGCADLGICYPPQRWEAEVTIPGTTSAQSPAGPVMGQVSITGGSNEFLPPYEAFSPLVSLLDGQTFELAWQIAPGYYLYRHNITVVSRHAAVAAPQVLPLPNGKAKFDEYFGETEVYYDSLIAEIPLSYTDDETTQFVLELGYQGCAEDGICYPPLKRYVEVNLRKLSASLLPPDAKAPVAAAASTPSSTASSVVAATAAAIPNAAPAGKESTQDKLARQIRDGNLAIVMGLFFVAGLGLALTPCVLPMIPILSGIIAGDKQETTAMRGFSLSLTYVLGMALTYTIAGALFAMAGQQAQAAFQHPAVLIGFAGLFVVLAISMFGAFELQMPSGIQTKLASISGNQKSGTFVGAFVMGALSSLIVTACVAPPLIAALSVISQTGDMVRGGGALFAMSMGMGAPLLVVGASAGKLMPKAGAWMEKVKIGFGFIMLALAIYILSRLLPGSLTLALFGGLLIVAAVYFGGLDSLSPEASGGARVARALGLIGIVYGAVMLVGALTGGHDPLKPISLAAGSAAAKTEKLSFTPVQSLAELESHLVAAKAAGQPVMLDFYADWCVSCKEMEKYTFTDASVISALSGARLLKADVTANNDDHQALLKRFGLFGPPSIIFFDQSGAEQPGYQVVGMMWPDEFAPHVSELAALGSS